MPKVHWDGATPALVSEVRSAMLKIATENGGKIGDIRTDEIKNLDDYDLLDWAYHLQKTGKLSGVSGLQQARTPGYP